MSRVQLALDVPDLEAAVDYYTRLFGVAPHKRRDGYANFAIEQPPLKLVLFEAPEAPTTALNHLGVEVESTDEVAAATRRFVDAGLEVRVQESNLCCHAVQDKVWATDPNGGAWEYYTILDDQPQGTAEQTAGDCAVGGSCDTGLADADLEVSVPARGLPVLP